MEPKQETMEKIIEDLMAEFDKRLFGDTVEHDAWLHFDKNKVGCNCYVEETEIIAWMKNAITHAIEAHDKILAEKVKFEIAGLAGMSNQIQDSGQAHIFEMKLGNILALLNKQI